MQGLTERLALALLTSTFVHTLCIVSQVTRRGALTAVAWDTQGLKS